MAALWITSFLIIERCSAMALMFNASAAVHSDASIGSEKKENSSLFRGTVQLDQAGRAARAAWAARYAEAAVLEAQRKAAEAEEIAAAKAAEYVRSRIEAKAEADKLVSLAGTSAAAKLLDGSENQMACQGWCSSAEHADKPWEKKCRWKDCKGCSTCTAMLMQQGASGTVSKKNIVNSVLSAVTHFVGNDKANLDGLVSELEVLSGAPAEKKRCDDSCSSQWVKGMNLQEQQSFKSWEARCAWKGCDGCKQCGNGAAARQSSAVTEKRCADSCSSQWVKGMKLEEQQTVKSWEARCAWKDCDGCKQCVHGA